MASHHKILDYRCQIAVSVGRGRQCNITPAITEPDEERADRPSPHTNKTSIGRLSPAHGLHLHGLATILRYTETTHTEDSSLFAVGCRKLPIPQNRGGNTKEHV